MEATEEVRQSRFFEWLARSVSPSQLSELYQAFTDLEDILSSHRFLHHLTQPLVKTEDADAINTLYRDLSTNGQFMRSYKSGVKLSLLRHYARYCRECRSSSTSKQSQEAVPSGDVLIDRLKKDGIAYADNRQKNGALWIAQSPQTNAFIKAAKAQGIHFVFSESRQQWWTRDASPKSIEEPEAIHSEIAKHHRGAFVEWLRDQGYDTVDIFSIYGTVRKIHALLLEEGVTQGLFDACEIDDVRAFIHAAKRKDAFVQRDNAENHLWTKAAECYHRFAASDQFAVKPAQPEQGSPEQASTPSAVKESQHGNEKPSTDLVDEVGFCQWLGQNHSEEQADRVLHAIHSAERFAQRIHMRGIRMFGVASPIAQGTAKWMVASNAFRKNDDQLYREFKHAAALLGEYAASLYSLHHDANSTAASTALAPSIPVQTDAGKKESLTLEPSLSALLQGERLSVLRDALIQKGVLTLERFRQLNLWIFMNQNGLYSIGERQAVYSSIRHAMTAKDEAESAMRWKILTLESEYTGASPAGALIEYCRSMAGKYPLGFRSLIGQRMTGSDAVPLSRTRLHAEDPRMDNPEAYVNCEIDAHTALAFAQWIGKMCRDGDMPQSIVSNSPAETANPIEDEESGLSGQIKTVNAGLSPIPDTPPAKQTTPEKPSAISPLQRQVEQLVLDADLTGVTLDQLHRQIPAVTMAALRQIRDNSVNLVDIADKLIHKDAFVDWDDAAQKLEEILEKLLLKNNGYVSSVQLYEYVRAEMRMFLNDNDMDDQQKVFDMAEHLFAKEGYHGKRYTFWMKSHISRGKETVTSNLDVIKKFARDHGGYFRYDDLAAYLEQVGMKTGKLRDQLQFGIKPIFFYYSGEEILSAESMRIDESWLAKASKAFERLFADVGDHVVLRSINPIWYEQLPSLPGYRPWTPLLLQQVLLFYGKELGAKTIGSELNQKHIVLHAMLVTPNSEIQTFADAVAAYLIDSGIPERQFEAEELRGRLVEGGLIAGNELIWNMPKAIGSDPRFAWDVSGENVSIKV